ncbi:NepR family anti-sigma factor [Halocynthiibacter sp. C4]|uniref:NepR family anti-sigma factor n=1 Tax=Halocynthiibacter sp. C4 TaxID=2992758 RepID=UPI00237C2A5D|nr:NepR family anti-sigma factor [Halocynthiibacter sp. C4]MDE0589118.1 NepR family anti-sigma factor [Halocynthiibacter sp. C4]
MPEEPKPSNQSTDLIDDNLKKAFRETLDEGVPDRFKDLLDQLKKSKSDSRSEESSK